MTKVFGIHPWDVERMTYQEFSDYIEALKDIQWQNRGK
jgi:hypothetical protein